MDPYVGEIRLFAGNYPPRNWAFCNGQILAINDNQQLFSLIGSSYGGNGRTSFGLPDMRGRIPMHQGQGPGLTTRYTGDRLGYERITLSTTQTPSHTHQMKASPDLATEIAPNDMVLAESETKTFYDDGTAASTTVSLDADVVSMEGNTSSHTNIQPYMCLNFIIALNGIYPNRN